MDDVFRWLRFAHRFLTATIFALAVTVPLFALNVSPAAAQSAGGNQNLAAASFLTVVSSGRVPGFVSTDVPSYLAARMTEAPLEDWSFGPISWDFVPPANRVDWSFRIDGEDGQAAAPASKRRYVARQLLLIEARLYLNGEFQAVTTNQVDIYGGSNDEDLAAAIRRISESLLGAHGAYQAIHSQRHVRPL